MTRYRLIYTESPTKTVIEVASPQDLGAVLHALEHGAAAAGWGRMVSTSRVDDEGNEFGLSEEEQEMLDMGQFSGRDEEAS